jgi:hypothetical protein
LFVEHDDDGDVSLEYKRSPIGSAKPRRKISRGVVPSWPVTKASFSAYFRGDDALFSICHSSFIYISEREPHKGRGWNRGLVLYYFHPSQPIANLGANT